VIQPRLLSILVPVYNERAYLRHVLERVLAAPLPDGMKREIIVVDDGSTDGSQERLQEITQQYPEQIRLFCQDKNKGKGAAIRRAISEMRGDIAIIQDADLEYNPAEYASILAPILRHGADVVYGSRFAGSQQRRVLNFHHELGNRFLTFCSNWFTGLNLTDMETCYKAFRSDLLRTIPLRSSRFGIEPEITAKVAKRRATVYEVPISYYGRGYVEGKKIGWKDGISALWTILKYWILDDCFDEKYGHAILHSLSHARRYAEWQVATLLPDMGERILEIGSGIGNISRLLPKREHLTVSDCNVEYLEILKSAFRGNELVAVEKFNLTSDANVDRLRNNGYDTIVCLNVLEHIADDEEALRRMRHILKSGGRLLLLVPQYKWLFGSYDRLVQHYRRYNRDELRKKLEAAGFHICRLRGFNRASTPGWWWNAVICKRGQMGRFQLKLFDMMVPLLKRIDRWLPMPGQSLIAVAEVRSGAEQADKDMAGLCGES
jgi:glycosyltransferase involved in cell wall biosynthesis